MQGSVAYMKIVPFSGKGSAAETLRGIGPPPGNCLVPPLSPLQ